MLEYIFGLRVESLVAPEVDKAVLSPAQSALDHSLGRDCYLRALWQLSERADHLRLSRR